MSRAYTNRLIYETDVERHSDLENNPEFAAKAAEIVRKRKAARAALRDPNAQRAKRAADFFGKSVIPKEEFESDWEYYIDEAHMTAANEKKEKELKDKYDDSGMKASMIKQYGPEKGKQVYFAYIRKQAMKEAFGLDEELLDEAKRSRAERRAANAGKKGYDKHGRPVPKGAVHAFDVDETIVSHGKGGRPNVKVHVKDAQGNRVKSLTNQEFNTHKLEPGHSFDFSEFRSAEKFGQTASPNKKVIAKVRKLQRRNKNVHLITARDKFDNPEEFRRHFERQGIKLKPGNIHYTGGMKGSDIGKKKVDVAKGVAKISGSKAVHMYDDAAKVHKAFEAEKKRNPNLKIKTHLAKPNKKGEVMTRSYQATKEDFELWLGAILDEGYDVSDLTLEDLCYLYADELLEEQELLEAGRPTAVGAPAPGEGRPSKKYPSKDSYKKAPKFKSPYSGRPHKKEYPMEEEMTPYDFWKSYIPEDEEMEVQEENYEYDEVDDTPPTSYEIWKAYMEEKYVIENQAPEEEQQGAENIVGQMAAKQQKTRNREAAKRRLIAAADEMTRA